MFKIILSAFSSISSVTSLGRYLTFGLIFISLMMGVLLAFTIQERNAIEQNLINANTTIKEKDKRVQETEQRLDQSNKDLSGCQTANQDRNEQIAAQQDEIDKLNKAGEGKVDGLLAALPGQLDLDRMKGATPQELNIWFKDLLK